MTGPTGGGESEERGGGPPEPESHGQARAYQGAVEAVFSVIIAAGIGYWADERFESSPWGLILGVVVGFAAMVLRLLRLGRELGMTPDSDAGQRGPGRGPEPRD